MSQRVLKTRNHFKSSSPAGKVYNEEGPAHPRGLLIISYDYYRCYDCHFLEQDGVDDQAFFGPFIRSC